MSLFVGNISKNVRKTDLVDEFEKFGKCEINLKVRVLTLLSRAGSHFGLG
jgi:RNA recognition motif-containing protein